MASSEQVYSDLPEVANYEHVHAQKQVVHDPEAHYPEPVDPGINLPKPLDDSSNTASHAASNNEKTVASICGLRKRTFYIVLAVILVVIIGALAGGLAGGLTAGNSDNNEDDADSNPAPTDTNRNVLKTSKLAASNWTAPDGQVYKTIFFQDPNNAIIARDWNSSSATWQTTNITQYVGAGTNPLNPFAGTSLASAARGINNGTSFETSVFFLTPSSNNRTTINWARRGDGVQSFANWLTEWPTNHEPYLLDGSQLAATNQGCGNVSCVDGWALALQHPGAGDITVVSFADRSSWEYALPPSYLLDNLPNPASMALTPGILSYPGRMVLATEALGGKVIRTVNEPAPHLTWRAPEDNAEIFAGLDNPIQLAANLLDDPPRILHLALSGEGSINGALWDGEGWARSAVNVSGGPAANFSAIAMTGDAMFYGISDDQVLEYSINGSDPFASPFEYSATVWPEG